MGKELQSVQATITGVNVSVEKLKNLTGTYEIVNAPNKMPAMMGWTAGTFVYLTEFLF